MIETESLKWILGIDQTGALARGRPKPLSFCLFVKKPKTQIFYIPKKVSWGLGLKALNKSNLEILMRELNLKLDSSGLIVVDAVLGLPKTLGIRQVELRTLFKTAHDDYGYGKVEGARFFGSLIKDQKTLLRRECETELKANSVFVTMPAQRNIQTGTHRIWKDLGEDTNWFSLWPNERSTKKVLIAEGYPSYFWKALFGFKKREPKEIINLAKNMKIQNFAELEFHKNDKDGADAAILGIGAIQLLQLKGAEILKKSATKTEVFEGVIFGV